MPFKKKKKVVLQRLSNIKYEPLYGVGLFTVRVLQGQPDAWLIVFCDASTWFEQEKILDVICDLFQITILFLVFNRAGTCCAACFV